MDPAVKWHPAHHHNTNDTPLLVNTAGSWVNRPTSRSKIPNLFLSGDYVQTNIDLATMEGGNESGRAAVNSLLEVSGSHEAKVRMFELYKPPELAALKAADSALYEAGLKNALDVL
jgi:uncharacterized protein with NAD-binding domain and iron-sulfur cluster